MRRRRVERRQRVVPEDMADDAGLLQRAALAAAGSASSRACSTPISVGGTCASPAAGRAAPPAFGLADDDAVVDEQPHQLFHVERVALGAADDQRAQRLRHARRCAAAAPRPARGCRLRPAGSASMRRCAASPASRARCSSSAGRVITSASSGTSRVGCSRCCSRSSEPSSAQCRSSTISTGGPGLGASRRR